MAYSTNLAELWSHKEFYSLRMDPDRNFREPGGYDALKGKYLQPQSHQLFVRNFMNPNTTFKRILLKQGTGTGKTLGAIEIAMKFIKIYKQQYISIGLKMPSGRRSQMEMERITPYVIVIGVSGTKQAFLRDLMKYPEFGFITLEEKARLATLRRIAESGIQSDIKHAREYYNMIKKRVTTKSKGGFFKFYGYQEFVNRLFLHSEDINLTDLESMIMRNTAASFICKDGSCKNVDTLESLVNEYILSGKIVVNQQLLDSLADSLIIVDEVHNTYNSLMKNNYGIAIQYALDKNPNSRAVFMSATPINNSPTESIDILNLLLSERLDKRDFFVGRELKPGALERIGEISRGHISFLQDFNPKYFPKREFIGDQVKLAHEVRNIITLPYLKFIVCPMSPLHQNTFNEWVSTEDTNTAEELTEEDLEAPNELTYDENWKIPPDGWALYDIVFPNPASETVGLFRSSNTKNKISSAEEDWKISRGINVVKFSAINYMFVGSFLHKDNIAKYSTKYYKLLEYVLDTMNVANSDTIPDIESRSQKIMIYHDRVKMSGVLLIQELLRANGFIDEWSEAVDNTICTVCSGQMNTHVDYMRDKMIAKHEFAPARFITVHADMDKAVMENSINIKFNSPSNANGLKYKILVGSKIIKESVEIKDTQHMFIVSLPTNVPTLIQVLGRCIRNGSHINLPPEQHKVNVYIFLSTNGAMLKNTPDTVSPEEYRYADKLSDYKVIQQIERIFNQNAVDSFINRDRNMPPELLAEYFPSRANEILSTSSQSPNPRVYDETNLNNSEAVDTLGNLYFAPPTMTALKVNEINLLTFNTWKYYEEEIQLISVIIKRLFLRQPVWTYIDLFSTVKTPPFSVEVNPKLFNEDNFIIALHNLAGPIHSIIDEEMKQTQSEEDIFINRLFDYQERFIYRADKRYKIEQVGEYYILFPVIADTHSTVSNRRDLIIKDIESYIRPVERSLGYTIDMESYTRTKIQLYVYEINKQKLSTEYDEIDFLSEYTEEFYTRILEEIISVTIDAHLGGNNIKMIDLYKNIIDTFSKFNTIIFVGELSKYKETLKQLRNIVDNNKLLTSLSSQLPIGYVDKHSVRLYDSPNWIEVSKVSMNRQIIYTENSIIIGYFDVNIHGVSKFKLRKPVHIMRKGLEHISETQQTDTRFIERGVVCSTKGKQELADIITSLGISDPPHKIKLMCATIRKKLIQNEMAERMEDGKYKWFYMFNEQQPNLMELSFVSRADIDGGNFRTDALDMSIEDYIW